MTRKIDRPVEQCLGHIRDILKSARRFALQTVNTTMIVAYWSIGKEIVEEEQRGKRRADYGEMLLERLSQSLQREFGKGYSVQNLQLIRKFYLVYKDRGLGKRYTLCSESGSQAGKGKIRQSLISESRSRDRKGKIPYTLCRESDIQREMGKIRSTLRSESATKDEGREIPYSLSRESLEGPDAAFLPELSWTHYRVLIRISDPIKRNFYEIECSNARWSVRELERQISSLLFERLARSRDKKGVMALAEKGHEIYRPEELIKDPYVLEFTGLPEAPIWQESDLEQALIDRLRDFLLELGKDLFFVARQKRITIDGDHFYIDLVFYHRILRCFLLIDLKVGKLTQADIGQMLLYTGYFGSEEQSEDENPPIGLVLCTDKNDAVVRYTLSSSAKKVFTSRYQLHLSSEDELARELVREREDIEQDRSEDE
jgi:predicted nuclease of restriction endonuclease-like (RecB) superfamily